MFLFFFGNMNFNFSSEFVKRMIKNFFNTDDQVLLLFFSDPLCISSSFVTDLFLLSLTLVGFLSSSVEFYCIVIRCR